MRRLCLLMLVGACGQPEHPGADEARRADMELLCQAEVRSGAVERFPFADKLGTLNGWLDGQLKEAAVRDLYFTRIPQTPVHQQAELLAGEAQAVGIEHCALAGLLELLADLPRKGLTFEDCVASCVQRHHALAQVSQSACERGCGASE